MNEWRECLGATPKQGQKVLVFTGCVVLQAEYWIHEEGIHDADTGFCDLNQDELFPVTHWMPLPEPPKP